MIIKRETNTKILWAIDAFADKAQQMKMVAALKALTKDSKAAIEPVMVLSPDQLRVPVQAFAPHTENYRLEADKRIRSWLKAAKLPNVTSPTLLVSNKYSRRSSVTTFLSYAEQSGATLIALSTRATKGLMRVLVGSFAETLLLHSNIPLYVLNPKATAPKKLSRILFTTDLTESSHHAFDEIIRLAKTLKAKVILYHKVEYVIPDTYYAIHQSPVYDKYLGDDAKERRQQLEKWEKEAKAHGVKTELVFDEKPNFIADAILKLSKKIKIDMIAIASHTGPAATVMLGSIARQVVRDSRCPVWVVHTTNGT